MEKSKLWKIKENANRVLEEFNYDAVYAYMDLNKHTWFKYGTSEIPSIEEIKITARIQMQYALIQIQKTGYATHCGTGGINVYIFPEWDGVKLSFEPIQFKKSSY